MSSKKEVTLKTKKKVTIQKFQPLHGFKAIDVLGTDKTTKDLDLNSYQIKLSWVKMALAVRNIDGKEVALPNNLHEVYGVLQNFDEEEWNEVQDAISELNGYKVDAEEQKAFFAEQLTS